MRYVMVLVAVALLGTAAVVVAGCGSGEPEDSAGAASEGTPIASSVDQPPTGAPEPSERGEAPMVAPTAGAAAEGPTEPAAPRAPADEPQEPAAPVSEPADGALVIRGTVILASKVPQPGSMPYRDCLTYVKYSVDEVVLGDLADSEALVVLWGMKDNVLQQAASFAPGDQHELKLVPLEDMPELSSVANADDTEEYSLTPYFALSAEGI